jgi:hypothetical protein
MNIWKRIVGWFVPPRIVSVQVEPSPKKKLRELERRDASRDESKLHSRNVLEKKVAELCFRIGQWSEANSGTDPVGRRALYAARMALPDVCLQTRDVAKVETLEENKSCSEPIVKGAYYEREDGQLVGPAQQCEPGTWWIGSHLYRDADNGEHCAHPSKRLTRRVYLVPTDPAEVVAELRGCQARATIIAKDNDNDPFRLGRETAWGNAADLVAEKLGVGNG